VRHNHSRRRIIRPAKLIYPRHILIILASSSAINSVDASYVATMSVVVRSIAAAGSSRFGRQTRRPSPHRAPALLISMRGSGCLMRALSCSVHTGTSSRIRGERPPPRPGSEKEVWRVGLHLGMSRIEACPFVRDKHCRKRGQRQMILAQGQKLLGRVAAKNRKMMRLVSLSS